MRLPANGSALANSLLVAAGIFIGISAAWLSFGVGGVGSSSGKNNSQKNGTKNPLQAANGDHSPRFLIDSALAELDPRVRSNLLRAAGSSAANENIADSLLLAGSLSSPQDLLDFHRGLFGVWADEDPTAALNHARDSFEPGSLQSETIGIVINKWGADNPHEAWVWSDQNLSGPLKERAMTDLMIGWTRRTPNRAADWLVDSGLTSQSLVNAVARTWAEQDPISAANWAAELPAGRPQQTAEVAVASEWAVDDPTAAAEFFKEPVAKEEGINLAIALTNVWATTDPAATAAWIADLPVGASRDQSAGALATIWAASDINAAVAWGTSITDPAMRGQVIAHLGTTWGAIEPFKAIDWLSSLPPNEAVDGLTGAFYSWAGTAPEQLQQWIAQEPNSTHSDQARLSLGDVLTSSDVPTAMDLALSMNSPVASNEALSRFFREWRKTDDPAAQDWIDANWTSLSSDAQARLNLEQSRNVLPR